MNIAFHLVFVAALAAAWTGGAAAEEDLAARGAVLAKERCVKCHGLDGFGASPDYPSLAGQNRDYFVKQIFNFKTGLRFNEPMDPVIEKLLAADIRALSHHYSSMAPGSVPSSDKALLAEGQSIYLNGIPQKGVYSCSVCHGTEAKGGTQMPRLAGQNPVYLEKQMRGFIQKTRQNDRLMHLTLTAMSARELKAVAVYLGNEK